MDITTASRRPFPCSGVSLAHALTAACGVLVLATSTLAGQPTPLRAGYNIDFNTTGGAGAGAPASTYGGGVGQPGFWNAVNSPYTGSRVLRNLSNTADGPTLTFTPINGFVGNAFNIGAPVLTGNDALLLADGIDVTNTPNLGVRMVFSGLGTGIYDVVVYAIDPGSTALTQIVWYGSTEIVSSVGGGGLGNPFSMIDGITFRRYPVVVLPTVQPRPGTFAPDLVASGVAVAAVVHPSGFGSVNGIQIVPRNPTRLYVKAPSSPPPFLSDGLSWNSALQNLHHALLIAANTPSVTEIWMQRGTYTPDIAPFTAGDREAAFVVARSGLSIIGGFVGTEATLAERPPINPATATSPTNATIISGEIGTPALSDNSETLLAVFNNPALGSAIVDGVTFVRQESTASAAAAVFTVSASIEIRSCRFDDNSGGVATFAGLLNIQGSDFTRHRRTAVYVDNGDVTPAGSVTINRCRFLGNNAPATFPASTLWLRAADGTVSNSLVAGNTAAAAAVNISTIDITLNNCTIAHNASRGLNISTVGLTTPSVTVNNSIFWGNRAASEPDLLASQVRSTSPATMFDSIVEGWPSALPNIGTAALLGRDPRFIDIDGADNIAGNLDDNYRLGSVSAARDNGWNARVVGTTDLDGNPRIVDDPVYANVGFATSGPPGFVDRGAYEAQTPGLGCNRADVAGPNQAVGADAQLTADDIIVFLGWYFANDLRADFAGPNQGPAPDGILTADDIIVFLGLYFAGC
ncbi:MAG: right-handed parallel beta-helix repeat-containing protein [Phycisphaerales bacterium]|jgi:hypothetical protein|nr:right-handed parallel beta-helix repeat-containing protein [Phycisphaerales bacterium]